MNLTPVAQALEAAGVLTPARERCAILYGLFALVLCFKSYTGSIEGIMR